MHWALSGNIFNESAWEELLVVLDRFEISYSEHKVLSMVGALVPLDWSGEIGLDPATWPHQDVYDKKNVIVIGPYSMRHIAKHAGWYPGSFDIESKDFTQQRAMWGQEMLNWDSKVLPMKDALIWDRDERRFVRPIHDSKSFSGKVFDYEEFASWQHKVCVLEEKDGSTVTRDTVVQVSEPKTIFAEYRCWVIKGKIITISRYKLGWTVAYTNWDGPIGDSVREYAQKMVDRWQPHEAFVIDVCDTSDGFKIVEINTLNSCGFYACDMQKLVLELEQAFTTGGA